MSAYITHLRHAVGHIRETHGTDMYVAGLICAIRSMRRAISALNRTADAVAHRSQAFRILNWLRADLRRMNGRAAA